MGFDDVLTKVGAGLGTAVGGAYGGPVGAAIGGRLGGLAGDQLGGLADDIFNKGNGDGIHVGPEFNFLNFPWSEGGCTTGSQGGSSPSGSDPSASGLTTGQDSVDTGRYLFTFKDGECKVLDKETNTWIRAWGDPHLENSDGDKAQFQENMTIDLPDGTKATFKTTPKDANGIALLDSVAIMKGSQAVVVSDISGGPGFNISNVLNNADAVDAAFADGSVLRAGHEIDDLTFAADGKEIVGSDPNAQFSEHLIDGKGGVSMYQFADDGAVEGSNGNMPTDDAGQVDGSDGAADAPISFPPGASIAMMLMIIMQQLEKVTRQKIDAYKTKSDEFAAQEKGKNGGETATAGPNGTDGLKDQAPSTGIGKKDVTEGELKTEMLEIQELQSLLKTITDTASNIQKSYSDTMQNIAGNLR